MTRKPGTRTAERITPGRFASREEYLVYLRHLFAYEFARTVIPPGSRILDIGCGEGYGTALLAQDAAEAVGLDIDEATVLDAAGRHGANRTSFKLYDGSRIPFPDNGIDAAVSFQVIEHVRDDAGHAAEIHRVLKPGGLLVLTTPNRTYRLKPGQKPWNRFHFREYGPEELAAVLKRSFAQVNVWGIRGSDEVQAIEHARVAWALRGGPVSALRRAMSEPVKAFAADLLRALRSRKPNQDFLTRYSTADFRVEKELVEETLDLLCLCRK